MAAPPRPPRPLAKGSEAERALDRLKADKSLEALEREALQRLKDDPKFNAEVQKMVEDSAAVKKFKAGGSRRGYQGTDLNNKVREELEEPVLEAATVRLWELLISRDEGMAIAVEARARAALDEALAEHAAAGRRRQAGE